MSIDDGLDWFHHPEEFTGHEYRQMLIAEVRRLREEWEHSRRDHD
jgi:hypothetical protein